MKLRILAVLLAAGLSACATQQQGHSSYQAQSGPLPGMSSTGFMSSADMEAKLDKGVQQLRARNIKKAHDAFVSVAKRCDVQIQKMTKTLFSTRSLSQVVWMSEPGKSSRTDIGALCAESYFLTGYTSLDLGRLEKAERLVKKAIEISPLHAHYLSELGHIYHVKQQWQLALSTFEKAEQYAVQYTAKSERDDVLARAKRGVGFSLIELGELDAAEAKFKECLDLNNQDELAEHELKYIRQLRASR